MAKGDLIFIDIETTGLDWNRHHAIEIAWMTEDMETPNIIFPHGLLLNYTRCENRYCELVWCTVDDEAMKINRFYERYPHGVATTKLDDINTFLHTVKDATLVGANVRFDAHFIRKDIGLDKEPWHHRLLDIEAYAAGIFGWPNVRGMGDLEKIFKKEYDLDLPNDHTAANDALAVKMIYNKLQEILHGRG